MKKILTLMVMLSLFACGKDDPPVNPSDDPNNPSDTQSFNFTVGNELFTGKLIQVNFIEAFGTRKFDIHVQADDPKATVFKFSYIRSGNGIKWQDIRDYDITFDNVPGSAGTTAFIMNNTSNAPLISDQSCVQFGDYLARVSVTSMDTVNLIMSGTLDANLCRDNAMDTVRITGVFNNVKFTPF